MALIASKGSELGSQLCEVMGLDPKRVHSLRLVFKPDSIVVAHVVLYVRADEFNKISTIVENYELYKRKDHGQEKKPV